MAKSSTSVMRPNSHYARKITKGKHININTKNRKGQFLLATYSSKSKFNLNFRYEAKTCGSCSGKIVEEKFISTSDDKYFHQDCYSRN